MKRKCVLGVLKTEKGIFDALTNHVDSEFHYIVDTFATPVIMDSDVLIAKNYLSEKQIKSLERIFEVR